MPDLREAVDEVLVDRALELLRTGGPPLPVIHCTSCGKAARFRVLAPEGWVRYFGCHCPPILKPVCFGPNKARSSLLGWLNFLRVRQNVIKYIEENEK